MMNQLNLCLAFDTCLYCGDTLCTADDRKRGYCLTCLITGANICSKCGNDVTICDCPDYYIFTDGTTSTMLVDEEKGDTGLYPDEQPVL